MPSRKITPLHYQVLIKIFERTNMTTAGVTRERFFEFLDQVG